MKLKKSFVLMSALLATSAFANQTVTTQTVKVTANLVEQELKYAPNSVSVVTSDEIVKNGDFTISDAVENVPGVQLINDGTPAIKRVAIRGEKSNRTVNLVDGQRISDLKTRSGAPLLVNPFFVERVELIRGPSSLQYGSDALGGIVNVVTKKASAKAFESDLGVIYNGSGNGYSEYLNATGSQSGFRYGAGIANTNQGDMFLHDHKRLENTAFDQKAFNAFLEYDFNDMLTAGINYEYVDSSSETSTTTDHINYKTFRAKIPSWKRQKINGFVQLNDVASFVPLVKASVFYQTNDKDFNSNLLLSGRNPLVVYANNSQKSIGAKLQFDLSPLDNLYITNGIEYRQDEVDSADKVHIGITAIKLSIDGSSEYNNFKQKNISAYSIANYNITDEFAVNAGVRYSHQENTPGSLKGETRMTFPARPGKPAPNIPPILLEPISSKDNSSSKTVASIGATYELHESTILRANYSQGFRAPSVQETLIATQSAEEQRGNPSLKSETSDNYELGIRFSDFGLDLDGAVFYTVADNYIEAVDSGKKNPGGQTIFIFENINKTKSFGLELSASYKLASFEPYTSVTWMKRQYKTDEGKKSYKTGVPSVKGMVGIKYNDEFNGVQVFADLNEKFASRYYNDNLDGSSHFENVELTGWATTNLTVGATFNKNITVYAGVENLFDKQYATYELLDEPGRFFIAGFNAKF